MRLFLIAAFLGAAISSANAACDATRVEIDITFCKNQCNVPHSAQACDGSGQMATYARYGDANGVRQGFAKCQGALGPRINAESCFVENPKELVHRACNVYGGCPCELTNSCPQPDKPVAKITYLDFNQPLVAASDNKNIIIADFKLAGKGDYRSITLNFTRDGANLFVLSTYAVNVEPYDDNNVHVKITTYDKSIADVTKHKYSVAGTLQLLTPP